MVDDMYTLRVHNNDYCGIVLEFGTFSVKKLQINFFFSTIDTIKMILLPCIQ